MSIEIMTRVFKKSKTRGAARLVLLSLADTASDEGECYPSIKAIALKAGVGIQTTRQYLHLFTLMGLVKTTGRIDDHARQTSNRYKILVAKIGNDHITGEMIAEVRPPSYRRRPPLSHTYPPPSVAVIPSPSEAVIDESSINPQKEPSYYPRKRGSEHLRLSKLFVEETGIQWLDPKSQKDWKQAEAVWNKPLDEMIARANGNCEMILRETIHKMRGDNLTIYSPGSCLKVFVSLCGLSQSLPVPTDPAEIDRLNREEIERFNRLKSKIKSLS